MLATETQRGLPPSQVQDSTPLALSVADLWMCFGPRAAASRVPRNPNLQAMSRADLRAKTGCTVAVRNVSFEVLEGEVFVIMGLSGSGKSTLVRGLSRLIEPTSGSVRINDRDVIRMDKHELRNLRRRDVSMVFQHFGLLPHKTVLENVAYGLTVRGDGKEERLERACEVIRLVGLAGNEGSYPVQLSGGMQQRVGLARALAPDPSILFFDEPFSALDPLIRRDMQAEVARLHREMGRTMVFITHDLDEALLLGDRIALMREGELVQVGTGPDLVLRPANDYVRRFVRDVPRDRVLTLKDIAVRSKTSADGAFDVASDTLIRDAFPLALRHGELAVMERGQMLGIVTMRQMLEATYGPAAPE